MAAECLCRDTEGISEAYQGGCLSVGGEGVGGNCGGAHPCRKTRREVIGWHIRIVVLIAEPLQL